MNVRGSRFADFFFADGAANSLIGGGGTDVVSYARAASGLVIDQTAGNHGSGLAAGDSYAAIATIVGSAQSDTFIGGTTASLATMDGAAGVNWVSYQYATSGATLDFTNFAANGGAATYDRLVNVENVVGSTLNDTFFADGAANSLIGGGGTDVVSYARSAVGLVVDQTGGGYGSGLAAGDSYVGIATIVGSAQSDTFIGGTAASLATMDGAAGVNWVSYQYAASGATLDLTDSSNNAGAATFDRLANVENVLGSSFADTFFADGAANSLIGGGGTDVVSYARATTTLVIDQTGGNHGSRFASGDSYAAIATIVGSAQSDTFIGGTTASLATMDGAAGVNWVSYQYAASGAVLDLTAQGNNAGAAQYDRVANVENVLGSSFADTFFADGFANSFVGGGGVDVVSYARAATGLVIDQTGSGRGTGFAASDTYAAIATIVGSSLSDTFIGGSTTSLATLAGGGGTDWISYRYLMSGVTVDLVDSTANGGGAQYDRLLNVENVLGSSFADTFFADGFANSFVGGGGVDIVSYAHATTGLLIDQTAGNHGTDLASGDSYAGIATILGGAQSDTFIGGTTASLATMDGAAGVNWVSYQYAASGATVDLTNQGNNGGAATYDRLVNVENVIGSSAADLFYADSSANSFIGGGGADVVSYARTTAALVIDQTSGNHGTGLAAGDTYAAIATIVGTAAADTFIGATSSGSATMDGAAGVNWVSYQYATSAATLDLANNAANAGGAAYDRLSNIENVVASSLGDTLRGDGSANSFVAGAGADSIDGRGGTDTVDYSGDAVRHVVNLATNTNLGGTAAGDVLVNIEVLRGGNLGDTLTGNATTSTTLYGGTGADLLAGGTAADYFDGGAGVDVVTYAGASGTVRVDQTSGGRGLGDAAGDTFVNVETIVGSTGDDVFIGGTSSGSATMVGGGGADLADYQYLGGGVGATVNLATGVNSGAAQYDHLVNIENVRGSVYSDTFVADAAANSLDGGSGSDWVSYEASASAVTIDLLTGGTAGGAAGDILVNIENLKGSSFADTFYADAASNSFDGGTGVDVVSYIGSTVGLVIDQSHPTASTGNASGDSYTNIETIYGSSLADTFIGGTSSGSAVMDGGDGANWVSYRGIASAVTIDLSNSANNSSAAQYDRFVNVRNVIASNAGGLLVGDSSTNSFIAGAGRDSFVGGGGDDVVSYALSASGMVIDQTSGGRGTGDASGDSYAAIATIIGSASTDTFIGGATVLLTTLASGGGNDWISYAYATVAATLDLTENTNNQGSALYDRLSGIENVIGSSGADTFFADNQANSFIGGGGADVVSYARSGVGLVVDQTSSNQGTALASRDTYSGIATIIGSAQADTFIGGTTASLATMDGGVGSDWVTYQAVTSGVTVDLTDSTNDGGGAVYDRLVNVENIRGTTAADLFYASSSANSFVGGGGTDVVSYDRAPAGVTVDQSTTTRSGGFAAGDTYSGIATIVGSSLADTFIGGTTASLATMDGASGSDWISYQYASSGATVDLTNSANNSGAATNDRFTNVENVLGSTAADLFYASSSANAFVGGGDTDVVSYARTSAAQVIDQTGSGRGTGFASGDSYTGVASIVGGGGADTFVGGTAGGSATMIGSGGIDWITYAGVTAPSGVTLSLGTSTANGGAAAADKLVGIENVVGSTAADTIYADAAANSIDGGLGSDWVSYETTTGTGVSVNLANHTATGGSSTDYLINVENIIGSSAADILIGDSGNNTFIGGMGGDAFTGGGGVDVVTYLTNPVVATAGLVIDQTSGRAYATSYASGDTYSGIATIVGSTGNDTFLGGTPTGSATMDGATGTNWISYQYTSAATLDLTNSANNSGSAVNDRLINVENVVGSSLADLFYADGVANSFIGGSGADVVSYLRATTGMIIDQTGGGRGTGYASGDTYAGVETIVGSTFTDTFLGGTTASLATMDGGAGTAADWISYQYAVGSGVTVDLFNHTARIGTGTDYFINIENVTGTTGADLFYADAAINSFVGGSGTDVVSYLRATAGMIIDQTGARSTGFATGDTFNGVESIVGSTFADTFIGNMAAGSATMDGSTGLDWITYQSATSGLTANLAAGTGAGSAGNDKFTNIENILGSSYADVFYASSAANVFSGGGGAGLDVVRYDNVAGGLTIDLTAGNHGSGNAAGDSYFGIATVIATTGADVFIGGAPSTATLMDGWSGSDWISYQYAASAATVNLATGTGTGAAANDRFTNIENVLGSTFSDVFYASSVANVFSGGGGTGVDVVRYDNVAGGLTIDLTSGNHGSGNASGDTYFGIASVVGTTGTDTFVGGTASGSATMVGNGGADWVTYQYVTSGATVTLGGSNGGAAANDRLSGVVNIIGSSLADRLIGDTSSNSFLPGSGADYVDGGSGTGIDTVSYAADAVSHTINLQTYSGGTFIGGTSTGGQAAGDLLFNIEVILGGNGGDTIIGYRDSATTIYGGTGADLLKGGTAADYFDGGTSTATGIVDVVSYDNSPVGLTINLNTTSLSTGYAAGDTYVNIEKILGSTLADTFIGGTTASLSATMDGGTGADWISYAGITGSTGATLNLANGTGTGAAANDKIVNIENIIGSSLADTLTGDTNGNTILAGSGNDVMVGSHYAAALAQVSPTDYYDGGSGTDTISYNAESGGMTVYLGAVTESGSTMSLANGYTGYGQDAAGSYDYYLNVENIIGSTLADILIGDSGANTILGGVGADTLGGGGGNDWLDGELSDNDTLTFAWKGGVSTGVTAYLGGITETGATIAAVSGYTGIGYEWNGATSHYTNIENIVGSKGADLLVGTTGDNVLTGNGGNDRLYGLDGSDTFVIVGPSTTETITIDGGAGTDLVDFRQTAAVTLTLALDGTYATGTAPNQTFHVTNVENVYGSILGADVLKGNSNNNTLHGEGGADTLAGGGGTDTLYGDAGNDWFYGGTGTELIDGGDDLDTVDYSGSAARISVAMNSSGSGSVVNLSGTGFSDSLVNIEAILGSSLADTFSGGGGALSLYGGVGNDSFTMTGTQLSSLTTGTIDGGQGTDSLVVSAATTSSLSDIAAHVTNVESLDVRNSAANSYSLTAAQINSILGTSGSAATLNLTLDSSDTLTVTGEYTSTTSGSATSYILYTDTTHSTVLSHLELSKV